MKAGRLQESISTSVSPLEKVVNEDEDFGEGGLPEGLESEGLVRIGAEEEGDFIRKLVDPKLPSKAEVELHELRGHVEYRNWCSVCVRCKGKQLDHQRQGEKERKFPEYRWDYCFPGDEVGYIWTVLVGRERGTQSWMATTVPMKGSSGTFAVDKCGEFFDELGDRQGTILIQTDQEPSI